MKVSVGLHVTVVVCPLSLPVIHRHCCTAHYPPADPTPDFQHAVARAVAASPFPAARVSRAPAAEEEHDAACVGVVVGLFDDGPPAFGAEGGGGVSAHARASGGCGVGLYMCVVGYIYGFLDLLLGVFLRLLHFLSPLVSASVGVCVLALHSLMRSWHRCMGLAHAVEVVVRCTFSVRALCVFSPHGLPCR